ncbi:MAG: gamma-glutamyl-gamma-aminobutyrate hydrolase family protein [Candidatus Diapherotrites archaeon]|nr:gamma-glutamyl-gamma-aminobutyrate hydrolase family protein [Candidatus Diapherotrites archaeon]
MKVLVIGLCGERDVNGLRFHEFVKPVQEALPCKSRALHFSKVDALALKGISGIVLSGTALMDNEYLAWSSPPSWFSSWEKPLLGICAGHHLLALWGGAKMVQQKKPEIGRAQVRLRATGKKDPLFKGLESPFSAYELHQNAVSLPPEFECLAFNAQCEVQAMRHVQKPFYGVEFHPEVLNPRVLENFAGLLFK